MSASTLQALVFNIRYKSKGIISIELRPASPQVLFPLAEAGAHLDLHLANGLVRSYSLTNPGAEQSYVIAVLHDPKSRGGSRFIHEQLRVGQFVEISAPRNHFRLDETAAQSVLVAGGIGITPIYAMLQRMRELAMPAELIYCARSREDAAYVRDLEALKLGYAQLSVHYHFDAEQGAPADLQKLLEGRFVETHFYCCGPASMMAAFEQACETLGAVHVHLERFAATAAQSPETEGYFVELKRSGKKIQVSAGSSLLDAMLHAGLKPDFSCREGVCGSCETKVLSGEVDHRDQILTKQEKAANKSMMICVSGCTAGSSLVLDA
jgi:ferredoxin-NADP reductase